MENIREQKLKSYIARIKRRSERFEEDTAFHDVFVDYGVFDSLSVNENEIIVGRRGTGKTHLLRTFSQKSLIESKGNLLNLYLDCRTLETGAEFKNDDPKRHAKRIFHRLLLEIRAFILEEASKPEKEKTTDEESLTQKLEKFEKSCSDYINEKECVTGNDVRKSLEEVLALLSCSLFIIILDEWVSFHTNIQPYIADILKRVFFPSNKICFKIGSIEYRQKLYIEAEGNKIGLEKSGDIFKSIDLDKFLVYDTDKAHVQDILAIILFNHIFVSSEESNKELSKNSPEKISYIIKTFFSSKKVFLELVRAGEGVVRDFLVIFYYAYLHFFYPDKTCSRIGIKHIRKAATEHYKLEKLDLLKDDRILIDFLEGIINHIIKDKGVRSFMVKQELCENSFILGLFDARLLHLIHPGWSHKDNPGVRYNIFTIDYGAYVELINTASQPQLDFFIQKKEKNEDIVPFDDKRKIRRIVLNEEFLAKFKKYE